MCVVCLLRKSDSHCKPEDCNLCTDVKTKVQSPLVTLYDQFTCGEADSTSVSISCNTHTQHTPTSSVWRRWTLSPRPREGISLFSTDGGNALSSLWRMVRIPF